MRIVKIIFLTILLISVVLFVGMFIFLKTVNLNRFKEQITEQISKSIGRDVRMKHVSFDFSVIKGITLHISGLSIMDLPVFSTEPMLYIDSSHLDVDVLSFLLKRQVLVSMIELNSLKVNLIRNNNVEINYQKLGEKKEAGLPDEGKASSVPSKDVRGAKEKKSKDFHFEEMLIRSIRITDGTFVFTDRTTDPPMMIPVKDIEFEISNLSFDAPFHFQLKASLFSGRKNINLNGLAQINAQNQQVRIDDLKIQTDLSDLSLDHVYEGIPALKDAGLKDKLDGKLGLDIHQMILGEKGLLVLSSDGRATGINAQFENSPIPVENLGMQFAMTESDVDIREITMPLASGEMKISGRLIEYLAEQKFVADLKLTDVQLSDLAQQLGLPVKLEGQIQVEYKLNGLGIDNNALRSFLAGEGASEIKNGRVKDVNILKLVLSRLSFIPNLAEQVEANLPEKYKEKLKVRDTVFEKIRMDTKIHEGVVFINKAEVNADGFLMLASGNLDLDQNLNLDSDIYMYSDLSARMVVAVPKLKCFLDEQKRIHILMKHYGGKLVDYQMRPDIEAMAKKFFNCWGRDELKKAIYKALDIDDEVPSEDVADPGQSPESGGENIPQKREPSVEEVLIENIFDMIPIFD